MVTNMLFTLRDVGSWIWYGWILPRITDPGQKDSEVLSQIDLTSSRASHEMCPSGWVTVGVIQGAGR